MSGSRVSQNIHSYREALDASWERYAESYTSHAQNAVEFYDSFLKEQIVDFRGFEDARLRRSIHSAASEFFGRDDLQFVSVDGTAHADPFNDFIVFSSVAYGIRGSVSLRGHPPEPQFHRRSMDEDVSFVAYVPVPATELLDVADEQQRDDLSVTGDTTTDLSTIHHALMLLSEVYLSYREVLSPAMDRPRLVLMDHSPSSIMASADIGVQNIGLLSSSVGRRPLTRGDAMIVYAHPLNHELNVPGTKQYRLYNAIIAEASRKRIAPGQRLDIARFLEERNLTLDEVERHLGPTRASQELGTYDPRTMTFTPRFDFDQSWRESVRMFEDICYRLFVDKDQGALTYEVFDDTLTGQRRRRWMSPEDVKFLTSIGIRALIEECWRKRTLLLGIVKDSTSRYFTRNYLGVARHVGLYDFPDPRPLPPTDRGVLECVAFLLPTIRAPWATVEFDSCFMTLHLGRTTEEDEPRPMGVKGDVVNQERLFARSLAQFFLRRAPGKAHPLMGHVIFVDRLLFPELDGCLCQGFEVSDPELGTIQPFLHRDAVVENSGHDLSMHLLTSLTRNLFPEAIGYPDPLHKADQGAKSLGRHVARMVRDSEIVFRGSPLTKTFRTIRDERRR